MPRDERYPNPLINMSPAGLPGLLVVIVGGLAMWQLFGAWFWVALGIALVVALLAAFSIRDWRESHPKDESLLHLEVPEKPDSGKH